MPVLSPALMSVVSASAPAADTGGFARKSTVFFAMHVVNSGLVATSYSNAA